MPSVPTHLAASSVRATMAMLEMEPVAVSYVGLKCMNFEVPLPCQQMFNVSGHENEKRGLKNLKIFTY